MREEFVNIWIHGDEQLEKILAGKITLREKLHHWPLSYVEKITLNNNTQIVYKSQRSDASVEKDFYSKIKMPFLLSPMYSETYMNCDIMILPYANYPSLGVVSEKELEELVLSISSMIQNITDMPVFFDLSSIEKLIKIIEDVCVVFEDRNEAPNIAVLKKWIEEKVAACYKNNTIGYVHGDLTASNILMENNTPCYILDWQRPMIAPLILENALAFRLAGYDAIKRYGDFGLLALVCHFIWYSYACIKFIPFVFRIAQKLLLEFVSLVK